MGLLKLRGQGSGFLRVQGQSRVSKPDVCGQFLPSPLWLWGVTATFSPNVLVPCRMSIPVHGDGENVPEVAARGQQREPRDEDAHVAPQHRVPAVPVTSGTCNHGNKGRGTHDQGHRVKLQCFGWRHVQDCHRACMETTGSAAVPPAPHWCPASCWLCPSAPGAAPISGCVANVHWLPPGVGMPG